MSASPASSISLRDRAAHSEEQESNEPTTHRKAVRRKGGLCQSESGVAAAPRPIGGSTGAPKAILTVAEVASELRCSKAHVCKAINGKVRNVRPLPAIAIGRRRLIRRTTLDEWLKANERALSGAMMAPSPDLDAVNA